VRVPLRGGEALGGDRRTVVAVDEIVRDARVPGVGGEERLEDAGRWNFA
jgi:hypothetical protein